MSDHPVVAPKKLIEVALPLDEINKASAREKSIRHGHPSTLHLWWAPRPLAAARAVLFSQTVNDPSWKYTPEELKKPQVRSAVTKKRNELFRLITELVQWESTTNEDVLGRARAEIRASWRETCEVNKEHPEAATLFDPESLPLLHDPFAGGGAIPLEGQRLGFDVLATDLNPVAVMINRAKVEVPPRFAGTCPVSALQDKDQQTPAPGMAVWPGSRGLAEDVQRYGTWWREQIRARIGHLYPTVTVSKEMTKGRDDLRQYEGEALTVIAWLWARTLATPNPAAKGIEVPLAASFWLSKKPGKEAWVKPSFDRDGKLCFVVAKGAGGPSPNGTMGKAGATCALSGAPIPFKYIRDEAKAGRVGRRLMAIVAEGARGRVYLSPTEEHEEIARTCSVPVLPDLPLPEAALGFRVQEYGILRWRDLFTPRQQTLLATCAGLVGAIREKVRVDAASRPGVFAGPAPLLCGDWASGYADAIALYLAFLVDKLAETSSVLCTWSAAPKNELVVSTFRRPTLSMTWDFAEANPFADSSGSISKSLTAIERAIQLLPARGVAEAAQLPAQSSVSTPGHRFISTDPPYYDNIGYADLSDFFYYWLRQSFPSKEPLFATLLSPKVQELIASPHRHGGVEAANAYFLSEMTSALRTIAAETVRGAPVTIYYAFKQADAGDPSTGYAGGSAGWETFLGAVLAAGLTVTATWPIRTERSGRSRDIGANALASSIVLACRPRSSDAGPVARRVFLRDLENVLPAALVEMTEDPVASVAPVDLAQAAIGPGMALFSQHKAVLEADGSPMTVHTALVHINKAIDAYFAEAEGDLDADTRFCIGWFQQHGFEPGPFGEADVLARAKGTSVDGVKEAGVLDSAKGKVRLLRIKEYPADWDPASDQRTPVWEACHHMCRALRESEGRAGELLARMPERQDPIRQLAYRLYTLCERHGRAEEARSYNELITSWPAIVEESQRVGHVWTQTQLLGAENVPPKKKTRKRP